MTTIRTTDTLEYVRDALARAVSGRAHFMDRAVMQRLIADLDQQAAEIARGGVITDPIAAAVDARLAYDRDPSDAHLSRVFIDTENRLTHEQFHVYQDRYRAASRR